MALENPRWFDNERQGTGVPTEFQSKPTRHFKTFDECLEYIDALVAENKAKDALEAQQKGDKE